MGNFLLHVCANYGSCMPRTSMWCSQERYLSSSRRRYGRAPEYRTTRMRSSYTTRERNAYTLCSQVCKWKRGRAWRGDGQNAHRCWRRPTCKRRPRKEARRAMYWTNSRATIGVGEGGVYTERRPQQECAHGGGWCWLWTRIGLRIEAGSTPWAATVCKDIPVEGYDTHEIRH